VGSPLQLDVRLDPAARATEMSATSSSTSASGLPPGESTASGAAGVAVSATARAPRAVVRGFDGQRVSAYAYSRLWSDPETTSYVLRRGQLIRVRAVGELSSADAKAGDHFETRVVVTIHSGRVKVVPAGSLITGRVEDARRATLEGGHGVLEVRFVSLLLPDGSRYKIEGRLSDAPQEARDGRAPDYLPDYDFKHKFVLRGGDDSGSGTRVVALTGTRIDASQHRPRGAATSFVEPSTAREEAIVRRDTELWLILKKDVKIPQTSGR
jgi:hypothetical protein